MLSCGSHGSHVADGEEPSWLTGTGVLIHSHLNLEKEGVMYMDVQLEVTQ